MLKRIADILLTVSLVFALLTVGFVTGAYWAIEQRAEEVIKAIQDVRSSGGVLDRKLKNKSAEWWSTVLSVSLLTPCSLSVAVEKETFQECRAKILEKVSEQQRVMKLMIGTSMVLYLGSILSYVAYAFTQGRRRCGEKNGDCKQEHP